MRTTGTPVNHPAPSPALPPLRRTGRRRPPKTGAPIATVALAATLGVAGAPGGPGTPGAAIGVARAQESQGPATRFVERTVERLQGLLRRNVSGAAAERRDAQVQETIGEIIDFQTIAEASLRRHWDDVDAGKRQEFVRLLRALVQRSYRKNLEETLDYRIRYESEQARGDRRLVRTLAQNRRNRREPPVQVTYELRPEGNDWRIVDVDTDGVGMVSNYRSQFNRIIREHDFDELLRRMRDRLKSDEDGDL